MTSLEALITYWVIAAFVSLYFSIIQLRKALRARAVENLTMPETYQRDWRVRASWLSIAISFAFVSAPLLVVLGRWIEQSLSGLVYVALSATLTLWTIKRVDDERSHDALARMLAGEPS